jgi:UDP-glucuronate decarboxylase
VRVARIFNTYGPRMHMNDGRVVSNFVIQALQNEPITVSDPGRAVAFPWAGFNPVLTWF